MHDRSEEYDVDYEEVLEQVDTSESLGRAIEGIVGKTICNVCEERKMFDEKNAEYYCPIHDK